MTQKKKMMVCSLMLGLALVTGCGQQATEEDVSVYTEERAAVVQEADMSVYVDSVSLGEVVLVDEPVALAGSPALISNLASVTASGVLQQRAGNGVIDYSNTGDGYVMVQYTADTSKRLKAQVKGPSTTYTYNLTPKVWITFPLSDGNGGYQVTVYENVVDNRYAAVVSSSFSVQLADEFAPFIRPNQYVNYEAAPNTVAKAAELTSGIAEPLKKVEAVYDYVVKNLTYDTAKAASVQSGYLPVLDTVLAEKKGICFDYAAMMAGMLRSQDVPCKLVVGYAGEIYHAWISVWTAENGWVDGVIYFDGNSWHRMDPTFASSNQQNEAAIVEYIGNGANYTTKYIY